MYLTLADIQAFLNFVNGNLGKKWYTDELPTAVSGGKKLVTTGVGLGSEAVDDISYVLGLASEWDMSTATPPADYAVGTRHIVAVGGTYNTIAAEAGDIVEWYSPSLFFVYPLASTLVRLPVLNNYATKSYVEGLVAGLLDDRGGYDPTITSQYPTSANNGSGVDGAVLKGDIWFFSADGVVGTKPVKTGYSVRALVDDPGQIEANWDILNVGLGYIPENVANKILSTGNLNSATNDQYASALLLKNLLALKADKANETHTGAMRVPSTLKIYDVVDATKEALFNVSNISTGQERTITVPDRDVTLGELPPFTPNTNYKAFSSIYDNNRLLIAKVDFTSGATLLDSDWYSISGSSAKYIISASQGLEANAEYFLGTDTTATLTFDIPDPQVVPPNSSIKIHHLEMQGSVELVQTSGWLPTSFGFAAPPYTAPSATVSISPLVRYTTTLTAISTPGLAYWVVQHQAGDWLTEPTLVNPSDYNSQVVFKMDNVTLSQQRLLYMADADMDLANLLEAATFEPKFGRLTLTRTGTPINLIIKRPVVYIAANTTLVCNTDYHLLTTTSSPTSPISLGMPNYSDVDDSGSIKIFTHQFDGIINLSVGDGSQSGFKDEFGSTITSIYSGIGAEIVVTPTKDGLGVITWRVQTINSKMIPVGDNGLLLVKDTDKTARLRFRTNAAANNTREATFPDADVDLGKIPTNLTYTAATAILTQTLTDNTSLSADLSATAVSQIVLTGSADVVVSATQPSTKYFLANSSVTTFDVGAFTNTGRFIEIVNNKGSYHTITLTATGKSFKDAANDDVAMPIYMVRGESVFVFPVSATVLQVYRNKPDIRNIKNNTNTVTSGFKVTNLFVDSSFSITGSLSASGDEILRIFALSSATINFGANVYDARTDTQISTGSYTLYAGQVLEVTKTSATKWVVLGGHIQDTSRFRLYNSSNVPTKFDTSAVTAERTIIMPDRDVDLGQVGLVSTRITPTNSGSFTLQSNRLYHSYQPSGGITSYTFILPSTPVSGDVIEIHDSGGGFASTTTLIFRANKTFFFPNGISASVSGSAPNIEWTDTRRATNKRWKFTYYADYGGFWMVEELSVGGAMSPELSAMRKANSSVGVVPNIDSISGTNKTITYPNRDVNLGKLLPLDSSVTYTNSERMQGQQNLGLTSTGNTVGAGNLSLWCADTTLAGTDNVAIGCSGGTLISGSGRVVAISANRFNTSSAAAFAPNSIVLGTSAYDPTAIIGGPYVFAGAVGVQTTLCTQPVTASGSVYSLTSDGENASSTNCLPALLYGSALMSARHEFDIIIVFGGDFTIKPSRTFYAKRTVYVARRITSEIPLNATPVLEMSVATPQPDVTLGLGSNTVTINFTLDAAGNRLIPTVTATSNPSFQRMQVSCRVESHYNRK